MKNHGMNHRRNLHMTVITVGLACSQGVWAAQFLTDKPFDLTVNVGGTYVAGSDTISGGTSVSTGLTTVTELFDLTKNNGLTQVNPAYTNASPAVVRFGYRGLPIIGLTNANSSAITLLIPSLNQTLIFGAKTTRDGNYKDVKNFLKNSGGDVLSQLQQKLAKESPIDPIAGNPASMQSNLVSNDYDRNFTQFATNIQQGSTASGGATTSANNNLTGIGIGYGSFTQGDMKTNVATLPLSYTTRSDLDPRRQFTIYAPISVSESAGAKSYSVNLGASYRVPVNDEWALTPAVGYGIAGSVDLGSAAAMMAASLTSQYTLRLSGFDFAIGNMIGLYESTKFKISGYSFNPNIRNTVFRNGVLASIPTTIMDQKMAFEVSFVNTLYTGTELYSRQYNELGLTLGTNKGANAGRTYLRAGLTLLHGNNDVRGVRMNLGYWF